MDIRFTFGLKTVRVFGARFSCAPKPLFRLLNKPLIFRKYLWYTLKSQRRMLTRRLNRLILPIKSSFVSHEKHCGVRMRPAPNTSCSLILYAMWCSAWCFGFKIKLRIPYCKDCLPKKAYPRKHVIMATYTRFAQAGRSHQPWWCKTLMASVDSHTSNIYFRIRSCPQTVG